MISSNLARASAAPITSVQDKNAPFESNVDPVAMRLMTGAHFTDFEGVEELKFVAKSIAGDGNSLFTSMAFTAYGGACKSMRHVQMKALSLRVAVCRTALIDLERMLSRGQDGWGAFCTTLNAYDERVTDAARDMGCPSWVDADPNVPSDTARGLFLLAVKCISRDSSDGLNFCFPILAETLRVKIRCHHLGESSRGIKRCDGVRYRLICVKITTLLVERDGHDL